MLLKGIRKNDCNKVMLFTNARDEPNINEWIAHHFLLGFDKIFIFDHLSTQPIESRINNRFGGRLVIKRMNDEMKNAKLDFIKRAVNVAKVNNASWMLYLDADEFLSLNKFTNVKDFLRLFSQADSVGVNWLMFGSSNFVEQPEGLLIDNFTTSCIRLDQHVKSFVRPDRVMQVLNPHYYYVVDRNRCYNSFGLRINNGPFSKIPVPFFKSVCYIAHYYVQSENEYKRRKGRRMDDGSQPNIPSSNEIHSMYNEVVNCQLKNKYSDNIKRFLQEYNI